MLPKKWYIALLFIKGSQMKISNEWFVGEAEINGKSIITRGRMFLSPLTKMGIYNIRIEINWNYKDNENGMPDQKESEQMDKVISHLTEAMEKDGLAILAATHVGANEADYIYYIKDINLFSDRLNETLSAYPPLPIVINAIEDPEWNDYKETIARFGVKE